MYAQILIVTAALNLGPYAQAGGSSSDCNSIRDSDARSMCIAQVTRDPLRCSNINDSNMRAYCKATVTGDSMSCNSISNADQRAYCKARTGH